MYSNYAPITHNIFLQAYQVEIQLKNIIQVIMHIKGRTQEKKTSRCVLFHSSKVVPQNYLEYLISLPHDEISGVDSERPMLES